MDPCSSAKQASDSPSVPESILLPSSDDTFPPSALQPLLVRYGVPISATLAL